MTTWTVVTTVPEYKPQLEQFIKSFPENKSLIIVFQKSEKDGWTKYSQNIFKVFFTKNHYEYGAWTGVQFLIDADQVSPRDAFFMVHDTCRFTDQTWTALETQKQLFKNFDVVWAHEQGCHNICLVKGETVVTVAWWLRDVQDMTKQFALELEGRLPKLLKHFKHFFPTTGSVFIKDLCTETHSCVHLEPFAILKVFKGKYTDYINVDR